jgi:hypothetical protein
MILIFLTPLAQILLYLTMELDDPLLQSAWPGEWGREAKDDAEKRMMDRTEAFGLRRLKPGDHLPPGLSIRIKEFNSLSILLELITECMFKIYSILYQPALQ